VRLTAIAVLAAAAALRVAEREKHLLEVGLARRAQQIVRLPFAQNRTVAHETDRVGLKERET
jgi:hypothetical protein